MAQNQSIGQKISKPKGQTPTDLEQKVGSALIELQLGSKDLASEISDLYICAAKELDVGAGKKAVVIFVPYRQHSKYKKIQPRLIRELEKKLNGKYVVILPQRAILSKQSSRKTGQHRPRSRTLTAVHAAMLEDLVFPTQIVGKRLRILSNCRRLLKILLDPKDSDVKEVENKLKVYSAIYKKLTTKDSEFMFAVSDQIAAPTTQ